MNTELLNTIFERNAIAENIKSVLSAFSKDHANPTFKKGFYIYGSSGVGKTQFVINILKSMNCVRRFRWYVPLHRAPMVSTT